MTVGVDGLTDSERLILKALAEIHNRLSEMLNVQNQILVETKDTKARQRITERTPPGEVAKPTTMTCKDWTRKDGSVKIGCGAPVRWGKVDGKSRLLNPDGTQHQCGGRLA